MLNEWKYSASHIDDYGHYQSTIKDINIERVHNRAQTSMWIVHTTSLNDFGRNHSTDLGNFLN